MRLRKRVVLLSLVLLLTAGSIFAHDKGDLMLNIEPQTILSLPLIDRTADHEIGIYLDAAGIGLSFKLRPVYWFLDIFGVSAGIGYSVCFDSWNPEIGSQVWFTRGYINIPFGVNFSFGMFTFGAGASYNILLHEVVKPDRYEERFDWFFLNNYAGWYLDIGFDTSGRAVARDGFGVMFRLSGSFTNNLAGFSTGRNTSEKFLYRDISLSIVYLTSFQLANLPIGSRKK